MPTLLSTFLGNTYGAIGPQGFQGPQGAQGPQGFQGNQGNQGFQGNQGNQGFQGDIGPQGVQGPQGPQGAQGFQGPQGFQGDIGPQGVQGFQGNQGNQGFQGAQGFQGPQGFQGDIGPQGAQGFQGNTGPVAGSVNQVVYKDGSNNPTGSNNLTFDGSQLNVYDLNVQNNLTIGGTSVYISATELRVQDKEIVLGLTTTSSPTDTTANHGGIAIASTEGSPLVPFAVGVANTLPETYKQIMWVRSGTYSGLGTDVWLFNYGVGIGSTQVPNGVRLAAGGMQVTDTTLSIPQINVSGISTLTGNVGIGTTTTTSKLRVQGDLYVTADSTFASTGYLIIPSGDNSQRPGSPSGGMIRYNSENNQFEGYTTAWGGFGGASGASGNAVFYENDTNVTASYSITSGKNAMSAGPITINNGVTVTVPNGSVWTVV